MVVVRIDSPCFEGHEADVGSRTTFDFVNQQHTKTLVPGRGCPPIPSHSLLI